MKNADNLNNECLIAVPALNEAATIARVVEDAMRFTSNVCVIDDGSKDNTSYIGKGAGATVISHEKTQGLGLPFTHK